MIFPLNIGIGETKILILWKKQHISVKTTVNSARQQNALVIVSLICFCEIENDVVTSNTDSHKLNKANTYKTKKITFTIYRLVLYVLR